MTESKMHDRTKLRGVDACMHCGKDLRTVDEIHAVEGLHFCSKRCAINFKVLMIAASAEDTATQWYKDCAEAIIPVDIGIVHERIWTSYSAEDDLTTIFKSVYSDKEFVNLVSTEVVGFYFGEPNDSDTEAYIGHIKATY